MGHARALSPVEFSLTSRQPKEPAPTKSLRDLFDTLHQQTFNGAKAHFVRGKDDKQLADLWRQRQGDPITVELLMRAFFERRDVWVAKRGYSVATFILEVPKLIVYLARRRKPGDLASAGKYADVMRGGEMDDADEVVES